MQMTVAEALFRAIEHGDAEHRQWLKDKLNQFFEENPHYLPDQERKSTQ